MFNSPASEEIELDDLSGLPKRWIAIGQELDSEVLGVAGVLIDKQVR